MNPTSLRRKHRWLGTVLIVSMGAPGLASDGLTERVVARQAHWPVRIRTIPGLPDGGVCDDLPASAVSIRKGKDTRLRVTGVARHPLPRIHALLIDTSHSMRTRIDPARTAAGDYLGSLPDGDLAMVASFDDTLVLRASASRARENAEDRIARLETGYETAMWDATLDMLRYLEGWPDEKILVLITDGEDSASITARPFSRVSELAESIPNLTIFAIGIDLPANASRGPIGALTGRTGGEFFDIEDVGDLSPVLRRIERRLAERTYVSYVPRPAAAGKLTIGLVPDVPCRIDPLVKPDRIARAAGRRSTIVEGRPRARVESATAARALAACTAIDVVEPPEQRWCVESAGGRTDATGACLFGLPGGEAIVGRLTDLTADAGPLYSRDAWLRRGRLRQSDGSHAVFAARDIAVLTPSLDEVRASLRSPADILRYLLSGVRCTDERPLMFLHGRTFLDARALLGRALLGTREDFRSFATDRVASDSPRWVDAFLEDRSAGDEARESLLAAVIAERTAPGAIESIAAVTAWLGDVPASTAAADLEASLAEVTLRGTAVDDDRAVVDNWRRLSTWFSPAARVRILTPLVPAFDPVAEALGFYRFLLPWPRYLRSGPPTVPELPYGVFAARALMPDGDPLDATVEGIRHGTPRPPELDEAGCDARRATRANRRVILDLVPAGAPSGSPAVELVAFFRNGEDRPTCVDVRWDPRADAEIRALGVTVRERAARAGALP